MVRSVISAPPVTAAIRVVTTNRHLPVSAQRRVYLRVGKKVRQDPAAVFSYRVGEVQVRFHKEGTIRELFWVGEFETDALPLFTEYARSAECVLDVGAAEGVYSLFAAAVGPTGAKVLAFEPGSVQLVRLRANVRLNAQMFGDRIEVVPIALSDYEGQEEFFELPGGTSSLNPTFRVAATPRLVEVARGDDVVPGLARDRRIDLIKVDTESTEPEVLGGLTETVRRDRPVIFCEVLRGRTEQRLQPLIDHLGYRSWWLSGDGPVPEARIEGRSGQVNWLFLPDDRAPLTVTDRRR